MAAGRELRYDRRGNRPRWVNPLVWLILAMSVVQVVVSAQRWGFTGITIASAFWLLWIVLLVFLLQWRTEIRVTPTHIHRPYLPAIDWGGVTAVSRPRPGDEYVRIIPRRGHRRVSIGLPVRYAEQVARIANKPLQD